MNERALDLTRANATELGLDHLHASAPDEVPATLEFDGIWSNPPVRVGKESLHALLTQWLPRLRVGAHAYLVIQKNLGADSLQSWLSSSGWPTTRLGSRAGYRLLDVVREDTMSRNLNATELKRLHRDRRRQTDGRVALILEDVQNPFNVGSIVRTAAAMSVDRVWLVGATPPLSHPKVQKTALGTQRYLTWTATEAIADAVTEAHADGYAVVGIELAETAVALPELELPKDVALVMGHEDRGLSKHAHPLCDHLTYIPQLGKIASLNVATATAIAVYEVRRRAWTD